MLDVVHHHEAGPVAVGHEAEAGVDGEAGDLGGSLPIDPGGEAHQVCLEPAGLLHLTRSHLRRVELGL